MWWLQHRDGICTSRLHTSMLRCHRNFVFVFIFCAVGMCASKWPKGIGVQRTHPPSSSLSSNSFACEVMNKVGNDNYVLWCNQRTQTWQMTIIFCWLFRGVSIKYLCIHYIERCFLPGSRLDLQPLFLLFAVAVASASNTWDISRRYIHHFHYTWALSTWYIQHGTYIVYSFYKQWSEQLVRSFFFSLAFKIKSFVKYELSVISNFSAKKEEPAQKFPNELRMLGFKI